MVTLLGKEFDVLGVLIGVGLLSALIYYIYCLKKKERIKWNKPIFFGLFVISILDFLLLLFASLWFMIFNQFPDIVPKEIIKIALITAIIVTFNFIVKNFKDLFKKPKKKK